MKKTNKVKKGARKCDPFLFLHSCLPRGGRQESSPQSRGPNGVEEVGRGLRRIRGAEQFIKPTKSTQLSEFIWRLRVCQPPPEFPIV